jgi:DMSO/TMAO reductase YedYZ heme-binding membrane subunit
VSRPDIMQPHPYAQERYAEDLYPGDLYPESLPQDQEYPRTARPRMSVDAWMDQPASFLPRIKRRSVALFFLRLPVFIPWIFIIRGWLSLNAKEVLTTTEADVLGTGGEICFFVALSITPLITLTGARWFVPLRRWYAIFFALIGISDATTAAITTDFRGGVFGRLAGHTFLVAGFLIVLMAVPLLATANTTAQRKLGRYWKRLHRVTYVLWAFLVLHLLLLDDFPPFGGPQGDGDPVFHQRFYQAVAISLLLVALRLPPVRRWVVAQREAGRQLRVWLTLMPLIVLYVTGFIFILNEEIFTGTMAITMNPPAD